MVLAPVEDDRFRKVTQLAVDAGTKALLVQLVKQIFEFALAAAHDGSHDGNTLAAAEFEDALGDLICRLPADGATAVGAVGRADGSVEQTQVVVDFRDGANSGARAAAGGFLLDGDGGAKAFNGVHVRALDLVKELAGVG